MWSKGGADLLWIEHKGLLHTADTSQTGRNVTSRELPSKQPFLLRSLAVHTTAREVSILFYQNPQWSILALL